MLLKGFESERSLIEEFAVSRDLEIFDKGRECISIRVPKDIVSLIENRFTRVLLKRDRVDAFIRHCYYSLGLFYYNKQDLINLRYGQLEDREGPWKVTHCEFLKIFHRGISLKHHIIGSASCHSLELLSIIYWKTLSLYYKNSLPDDTSLVDFDSLYLAFNKKKISKITSLLHSEYLWVYPVSKEEWNLLVIYTFTRMKSFFRHYKMLFKRWNGEFAFLKKKVAQFYLNT